MLEWVLDTKYGQLFDRDRWAEASIIVYLPESTIAPLMVEINSKYKGLKAFSLPSMGADAADASRRHIELGVRGTPAEVEPAMADIRRGIEVLGGRYEESRPAI
jgi:molybdopterin-biosynthesis enzyme MoeA-like protein